MFIGAGTVANVSTIVVGSGLGLLIGHRLNERIRSTVTAALGLVTLLIAADAAFDVRASELTSAVGRGAPTLIVLGSLLCGGIVGSWARLEDRLEDAGDWVRRRLARGQDESTFVEGFVMSTLVFCVGPLTILGSLNEGIGRGADQILLKAVLDGFASLAFAASFGIGVMLSAASVGIVQALLTFVGFLVGSAVPEPHLYAISATGGLILIGVALRLLEIKSIPVADLLPSLLFAPILTTLAIAVQ